MPTANTESIIKGRRTDSYLVQPWLNMNLLSHVKFFQGGWQYISRSSGEKKLIWCYKDWELCLKLYTVLSFKALNQLCCPHSPWLLSWFFHHFSPGDEQARGGLSALCPSEAQGCHPSAPRTWKRFLGKEQRPRLGWLQWIILFAALRINNNFFIS